MNKSILHRTAHFSTVTLLCTLRHMRNVRDAIRADINLLQEQVRAGHDGARNATIRTLDSELSLIEDSIAVLWQAYNAP